MIRALILGIAVALAPATALHAADVLAACEPDIAAHCESVTPGDGRLAACLYGHEDRLTDACDTAMGELGDVLDTVFNRVRLVRQSCGDDIQRLCDGVAAGDGRVLRCLGANRGAVGPACAAMLGPVAGFAAESDPAEDPLPSWNDGATKEAILSFVDAAADPASEGFIAVPDRIAVFDNDGTLWAEQPVYFQFFFAMDRAAALAAADPSWAATPALEAAAAGDLAGALEGGEEALLEIVSATHSGMTVEAFTEEAAAWLEEARHPETGRRFDAMVYQPMLELLDHLRATGFDTYIVSGGGVDFMRAFAERVYGVPPEQVIGTMTEARFEIVDGAPRVEKDPGIAFLDDKGGKPVGIARHIGRRPVFVGGNSDGDLAMAQWSTAGEGPRFALFIHHTDEAREWAYDRDSHVGRLDAALDEAATEGWTVVDMAEDWATIWPEGAE